MAKPGGKGGQGRGKERDGKDREASDGPEMVEEGLRVEGRGKGVGIPKEGRGEDVDKEGLRGERREVELGRSVRTSVTLGGTK